LGFLWVLSPCPHPKMTHVHTLGFPKVPFKGHLALILGFRGRCDSRNLGRATPRDNGPENIVSAWCSPVTRFLRN
jgi:hypothetical protein